MIDAMRCDAMGLDGRSQWSFVRYEGRGWRSFTSYSIVYSIHVFISRFSGIIFLLMRILLTFPPPLSDGFFSEEPSSLGGLRYRSC